MKTILSIGLAFLGSILIAQAKTVEVTINATAVRSFIEFKVESDQKGEQATGHIKAIGKQTYKWEVGDSSQNIWFWWDTLNGNADLTVKIDGVVLFDGSCAHVGEGEVSVINTCSKPNTFKQEGSPRLQATNKAITYIKF